MKGKIDALKKTMREKIVLRKRTSPKQITLPNSTTFVARYARISKKIATYKHSSKKC